ncbi:MAG: BCCT family transporter [Deltaproteobacteria bacterium]|jgi:choline/glycine/proline betaine transport protein/glycine betaine transporter|nr:BCCT family transporter [Deltaproteobacteria bacterium]
MTTAIVQKKSYDSLIFGVSGGLTVAYILFAFLAPQANEAIVNAVFQYLTMSWGWAYLWVDFIVLLACFFLIFHRFGDIKLCLPGEKPEFKDITWFGMLFSGAIAAGIVFWGPAEPPSHMSVVPPLFADAGVQPNTTRAAIVGTAQSFFHTGVNAWCVYAMLATAMCLGSYVKGLPMRFSSAFYVIFGDRVKGNLGRVLDIFAVLATLGGMATTTGLIALQLGSGLQYYYGFELGQYGNYIVIGVMTAIFTFCVYTGLQKGIKLMADVRMGIFIFISLFIILVGPTVYIFDLTTAATGQMLQNFVAMCLYPEPGAESKWAAGWTVFYWAWWMAWAPFVSQFIARISKARSVRSLMLFGMLVPAIISDLWYGVAGGAGIFYQVGDVMKDHGAQSAIFALAKAMPLSNLTAFLMVLMVAIFFLTVANAASMSLSMFVSGHEDPARWLRTFWALALGFSAMVLTGTGQLSVIQTASIAGAVPMVPLLFLLVIGVFRAMNRIYAERYGPAAIAETSPEASPA